MSEHEGIDIAITGCDDATLEHYYGRAEDDPDQLLNLYGTALVGDIRYPFTYVHGWDEDGEWFSELKVDGDDWAKLDEHHQFRLGNKVQDVCKTHLVARARDASNAFHPEHGRLSATLIGWNR